MAAERHIHKNEETHSSKVLLEYFEILEGSTETIAAWLNIFLVCLFLESKVEQIAVISFSFLHIFLLWYI